MQFWYRINIGKREAFFPKTIPFRKPKASEEYLTLRKGVEQLLPLRMLISRDTIARTIQKLQYCRILNVRREIQVNQKE